jgi:fido (protein-threonine AMPylation protein)
MIILSQKQQKILYFLLKESEISSSRIHAEIIKTEEKSSLVTIKRLLKEMVDSEILQISGSGRSTVYLITAFGRMVADINAKEYCSIEPDKRFGQKRFNFDLLPSFKDDIFDEQEKTKLESATAVYRQAISEISETIRKKEWERMVIELSWKSSRIEGNTYTLLDTEKLILENKAAAGKTREETQMVLNHKEAFDFIRLNSVKFKAINRRNMEEVHAILIKDLGVGTGLRKKSVGVVGSAYHPLDNIHQIGEAVEQFSAAVSRVASPYAKALLALAGISYIQPFEDGNKRTGRLMANALLMAHGLSPLSYRSVDESDYREALLVFYELNSIVPIKKIFVEQYDFASRNYSVE